jgi:hypothetical protein
MPPAIWTDACGAPVDSVDRGPEEDGEAEDVGKDQFAAKSLLFAGAHLRC